MGVSAADNAGSTYGASRSTGFPNVSLTLNNSRGRIVESVDHVEGLLEPVTFGQGVRYGKTNEGAQEDQVPASRPRGTSLDDDDGRRVGGRSRRSPATAAASTDHGSRANAERTTIT